MSEHANKFAKLFDQAEQSPEYWRQSAALDFAEDFFRLMEESGVSRAELARRMGTSQAYITQALRADANFTLGTMTRLAMALGHIVRIHLAPRHSVTVWRDAPYFPEDGLLRQHFDVEQQTEIEGEGAAWDEAGVLAA
jgi:transcriptional regulator with XRE-family HTH domain